MDLFATQETVQCPLWYSLVHPAPLGLDAMVQAWPRLRLYAFPPITLITLFFFLRLTPRSSGKSVPGRSPAAASSPVLAGPSMVLGPDFSPQWFSRGDSCQEGSPLTGGRHPGAPPPGVMEICGCSPEGAQLIASGFTTHSFRVPNRGC